MIDFPAATRVHRKIPKEAFYRNIPMTNALKEKFVSDIESVFVDHVLNAKTLNLQDTGQEILVLSVHLKKQDFDAKIIEAAAKSIKHRAVFIMVFGNLMMPAVYQQKLYLGRWSDGLRLTLEGFSPDEIWHSLAEQVMRSHELAVLQQETSRLQALIERTENAARREVQPKKKYALYTKLKQYQQEMNELQCRQQTTDSGNLHSSSLTQ